MRIVVAACATHVREAERQDFVSTAGGAYLMTVRARYGSVSAGQNESSVTMFGDGKCRTVKILHCVAAFTFVFVGRSRKLPVMRVLVAVQAGGELHLVDGVFACRQMAFRAFDSNVFSPQRISGGVVLFDAKERWLPAFHRMALRAFAFFGPRFELALVRIRLMAVVTIRKRQRLLEFPVHMTLHAIYRRMLAQQRIFRFRVVEFELGQKLLPACGSMTILAALLLERTFVRIVVARRAGIELHVLVARRTTGHIRLVTLLAGNLNVRAGQGIARFRVVELLGGLPIREVVAALAVIAELSLVWILVTGYAFLRQAPKRLGEVLHLDQRAFVRHHVPRHVTLFTRNVRVLPLEVVAGQSVIKLFLRWFPVD